MTEEERIKIELDKLRSSMSGIGVNSIPQPKRNEILSEIDKEIDSLSDKEKSELLKSDNYNLSYNAFQQSLFEFISTKYIEEYSNTKNGKVILSNFLNTIKDCKKEIKTKLDLQLSEANDFRIWSENNPNGTYSDFLNYQNNKRK